MFEGRRRPLTFMTPHDHDEFMKKVGVADLKAHLSEHLHAVQRGESITVLQRREPVARIVPVIAKTGEIVVRPARAGLHDLRLPGPPRARSEGDIVAELLADRAERL